MSAYDRCPRGCPDGECYCAEPSYADPAYTGICPGCGAYEECYCGGGYLPVGAYGRED